KDAVKYIINDASGAIVSCVVDSCLCSFRDARSLARSQFIPRPAWQVSAIGKRSAERRCVRSRANPRRTSTARSIGFRQRVSLTSGAAAENVAYGCATEDCVIRMWARSGRHRANMLRRGVTSYGIASAIGANGKRYWVLELGT